MPHKGLVFNSLNIEDLKEIRPMIVGVNYGLTKYLGDHKNVQEWDFIERGGELILLVPKRYVIFSRGRILSICLLFESESEA